MAVTDPPPWVGDRGCTVVQPLLGPSISGGRTVKASRGGTNPGAYSPCGFPVRSLHRQVPARLYRAASAAVPRAACAGLADPRRAPPRWGLCRPAKSGAAEPVPAWVGDEDHMRERNNRPTEAWRVDESVCPPRSRLARVGKVAQCQRVRTGAVDFLRQWAPSAGDPPSSMAETSECPQPDCSRVAAVPQGSTAILSH